MTPFIGPKYDISRKFPCPCGKGEYLYEAVDRDWGPPRTERHTLLCAECKGKYLYDRRDVGTSYGGVHERGWVLKEDLLAEQRYVDAIREYQQSILHEVERRCRAIWREKLVACRTKKAIWQVAVDYSAYGTFLSHHRGKSVAEMIATLSEKLFYFSGIAHVLKTCGIDELPERLTTLAKPVAPRSLPDRLREMVEQLGADVRQGRSDAPSLESEDSPTSAA